MLELPLNFNSPGLATSGQVICLCCSDTGVHSSWYLGGTTKWTSQQQLSSRSPTPSCNILQYPSCNFLLSRFKVSASHVLLSEVSCARYHFLYSQLVAFCMSHHDSLLQGLFNMQCVLLPQPRPLNDLACDCRGEHCAWLLCWEGWASRYHWEVQVHLSQGFWIHDMY